MYYLFRRSQKLKNFAPHKYGNCYITIKYGRAKFYLNELNPNLRLILDNIKSNLNSSDFLG